MLKNTELQDAAFEWITRLSKGEIFDNQDLYRFLEHNFSHECSRRGDSTSELRYKNDARWAVQRAKRDNWVKPTGRTGQWQRS